MEGISHEVASFAGTQQLGKLIVIYDDNGISIDGKVKGWFADDTPMRFEAYGWHVLPRVDGHDSAAVAAALAAARAVADRPSLICCQNRDRLGRAQQAGHRLDARRADGRRGNRRDPRGAGLDLAAVRDSRRHSRPRGTCARRARGPSRTGARRFAAYKAEFPDLAAEFERRMAGDLPQASRRSSCSQSAIRRRPRARRSRRASPRRRP